MQIAKILVDENEPAYNADSKPNWNNYNGAYSFGNIGQCAWYARSRFYETTGIDGVIKKESFNDFINRSMHGEIKGYVATR